MATARLLFLPSAGRGTVFLNRYSFSAPPRKHQRSIFFGSEISGSQGFGIRTGTNCVCRPFAASIPFVHSLFRSNTQEENTIQQARYSFPRCASLVASAPSPAASATHGQQAAGRPQQQQRRSMSSHEEYPPELTRGTQGSMDIPVGGEGYYRRGSNIGMPMLFVMRYDRPTWQPLWEDEHEQIPRDGFGVPAHIPPEVSQDIKHVYHVPPQFYHFLKKLGDDTPALQPYVHKLINGDFTHDDYEEMFYKFAKPLKIYRRQIPMPYRTPEEVTREEEVAWEGAWLSYRQRVLASYNSAMFLRELVFGGLVGIYFAWIFLDEHRQYRLDMKLFYLEAPEHKVNWVKPRGDLV